MREQIGAEALATNIPRLAVHLMIPGKKRAEEVGS
jgi:hypothetical protein